jgi:dTMP kinase
VTRPGRWIALEGGEASGKSTQARLLAARLDAVLTREPGGTPVGARMREVLLDPSVQGLDPRAETLLMAADRAQHVSSVVRPALAAGRTVVSDRSAFSSIAYQGYGRGLALDEVQQVSDWATCGLWPSLVVLVDVGDGVRAARLAATGRAGDRMEEAGDDFHRRVNDGFRAMAAADPARWVVVDGGASAGEVASAIDAAVDGWMATHG